MKAKKLAFCAVVSALSLLFLYLAFVIPTGKVGFYVAASVFLAAVVLEAGARGALLSYVTVSVLAFLLIPDKIFLMPFVLFFGYYPVAKQVFEAKIKNRIFEYGAKLLLGNAAFFAVYFLANTLFLELPFGLPMILFWLLANVVFVVYDYLFSLLVSWYLKKIRSRIRF